MRIEQEPDVVPRSLLTRSSMIVAISIAASIGATVILAAPFYGEVAKPFGDPPTRIDEEHFSERTAEERARAAADQRLDSYGWVDRERGIVHVPLAVAIELYLAEVRR
jgi:hypothetical protein